jgi:hypothetical protein
MIVDMDQQDIIRCVFTFTMDQEVPNEMIIEAILYTLVSQEVKNIDGVEFREAIYDA